MKLLTLRRATCAVAVAAAWVVMPTPAWAQAPVAAERESLEALRDTTLALIEALVQSGTLTREKANALLADAKARAAQATQAAQANKPDGPTVRVPYVPQVVRDQIRNEVKEEVLARAKVERWGVPNATAEWTDRLLIEGDVRVRSQSDRPSNDNPSPQDFLAASLSGLTRAPDLAAGTAVGLPTASTQDNRDRLRLRARLGINAKVADNVVAGLRLATGSSTDRVSTNQTLGQNFNRSSFLLDRAFIKFDFLDGASVSAGRIANPWFSTDLIWSDNLNFEGIAATYKLARLPFFPTSGIQPFATVGYFPIREDVATRQQRYIKGAQIGAQWDYSDTTRLRFGVAMYSFRNFAGYVDNDFDAISGAGRTYGQFEYEAGLRQRGNTLFLTNSPLEIQAGLTPDKARWGMAARFKPLAVTAAAEFSHFAPFVVGLSGELVRNQALDYAEILQRTGVYPEQARAFGVGLRGTFGAQSVRNAGDWQVSLAYRWLGSDAVPDAFVDSDLGLGGTNVRGVTLGLNYGLARDTQIGLRYLSGRTISSPTVQPTARDSFSVDSLQVDMNVRF
jgi:Putative porin